MNPRPLSIFAACVLCAALLWCWFLLSREPDAAPRRTPMPPSRTTRWPDTPRVADAPWPAPGTPEFRDRLRDPAARWLDSRGRDAAGLIAIWDLCRDADLLDEAASRFPDHPCVCRAMIETCTGRPDQALFWIEKLIALEPGNPEGHYLKAWALFARDDAASALTALRAATAIGLPRDSRLRDRTTVLSTAATALGLPARAAALAPVAFLRDQDLERRFYDRAAPVLTRLMEEAREAGDADTVARVGRTALAASLNQGTGFDSPPVLTSEAAGNRYLRSILHRLPDDWTWDPGNGYSAAEWKAHAQQECVTLARANALASQANLRLAAAPDEVVAEYARHFLSVGELEANAWLLARAESPQAAAASRPLPPLR